MPKKIPIKQRFEEKIELIPFTTCWIWIGNLARGGYGQFYVNGKYKAAHRVSYELYKGYISKGIGYHGTCVCHSCDTPGCVNPNHLFLGTVQDNTDDKVKKNRHLKGEAIKNSKLTEIQVKEIRIKYKPYKYSIYKLAEEYNVSSKQIHNIINNKEWIDISYIIPKTNLSQLSRGKLSVEQIKEIKLKYIPFKYSTTRLGKEYNVDGKTIYGIVSGKTYKTII